MLLEKSATLLWSTASPTLHKCILTAFRSTSSTARKRRLEAFNAEREQQQQKYGVSIEKVIVSVQQEDQTERHLLMNDHLSTFHDCAKHISRLKVDNTALVHVTKESDASEYFASPHTTVDGKSKIKLLSFNTADYADHVNTAYWRSCAFLLGALAETSLRADVSIIGALPCKVESGRFIYATCIDELHDWKPSQAELDILTRKVFRDYIYKALPFEPIRVPRMFAAELFAENQRKADCILNHEDDDVILCKVGEHVDVVEGPVISNTRQIGRFAVTGVDYVDAQYHFRGVSLPSPVKCSSYSWDLIVNAATVSSAPRLLQSGTEPSQNELEAS